jgi:hypothetical protein
VKRYGNEEIQTFLRAIDQELKRPFELRVIGGTAVSIGYQVTEFTQDIDTVNQIDGIREAYDAAKLKTGLNIPMEQVGVYDAPYNYEERLIVPEIAGLKKLTVKVPERHDLVLMKAIRGYEHDLNAAVQINEGFPFSFDTLVERMKTEMTHVTGNKRRTLENVLAMIEGVFGESKAKVAQKLLMGWDR